MVFKCNEAHEDRQGCKNSSRVKETGTMAAGTASLWCQAGGYFIIATVRNATFEMDLPWLEHWSTSGYLHTINVSKNASLSQRSVSRDKVTCHPLYKLLKDAVVSHQGAF